ncbi:MAG: hypothetical protein ACO3JL_01870 [Myxococcota bacterium]|jgi:hypothetical protein
MWTRDLATHPLPATSVAIPDGVRDPEAFTDDELRAVARRQPSPSAWLAATTSLASLVAFVAGAYLWRGPALDHERERPRVRAAVLAHQFDEVLRRGVPANAVFCVALFGGVDPLPAQLAFFQDHSPPVVPVSHCHKDSTDLAAERQGLLFSVGQLHWRWTGEVDVYAGADHARPYRLRLRDGQWEVQQR